MCWWLGYNFGHILSMREICFSNNLADELDLSHTILESSDPKRLPPELLQQCRDFYQVLVWKIFKSHVPINALSETSSTHTARM